MRYVMPIVLVMMVIVGWAFLGAGRAAAPAAPAAAAPGKVRVGTYDSRAIAVAFAGSEFFPVKEKMAEMEKAKAAGDKKKAAELEAWGKDYQRTLHFQGFSKVPVDDLLEPVKAQVAKLAADQGLAAIADDYFVTGSQVEVVDVTDPIVEMYKPNDKSRANAKMIRGQKPVALTAIADMPADK
jgi:hypothetical protein